jgi:hypothetical protein
MWWDIIPIYGQPDVPERSELDQEILGMLESTLQLDSIACRESALHGLGRWPHYYPVQVGKIIDAFLMMQFSICATIHTKIHRKELKCKKLSV